MTLRISVEIVPQGQEHLAFQVGRLDISNVELVEDQGFGHQLCRYIALERDTEIGNTKDFWPDVIHDRRDGFWALIRKVIEEKERDDGEG